MSEREFIRDYINESVDTWFKIGLKVDVRSMPSFCATNYITKSICDTDYFWLKKAEKDFNYPFDKLNAIENLSGKDKYRTLYQNNFKRAIDENRVEEVEVLLGSNKIDPSADNNYAIRESILKNNHLIESIRMDQLEKSHRN